MNQKYQIKLSQLIKGCCIYAIANYALAQPIVVEGVVPNEASKQAILMKMQSVYGADQVVDKIQVRPVAAPNGWSDSVTRVITPDLKKVSQGKLSVNGTRFELTGKMLNPTEIQPTIQIFQGLVQPPYQLFSQLSVNQAEQKVIDDALKNRIIEFESGSAVLTDAGQKILDEMAVALNKVGGKKVKIVGHTDSSGDATKNLKLSQDRALAVKNYLVSKNIPADHLSAEGLGSTKPVADNTSPEGRKKTVELSSPFYKHKEKNMASPYITIGCPTTGGGQVISGNSAFLIDGIAIACVGDKATCPAHKTVSTIVSGDPNMQVMGKSAARVNDSLSCGCKLLPKQSLVNQG